MLDWFLKADKGADLFVRWFTMLTVLSGGFAWLTRTSPWFGERNLSEAILIGIAMALATLLIVAVSLALIRQFRPPAGGTAPAPEENNAVKRLREEADYLKEKYQAVISDYQRMSGLEARFSDMLDGLKRQIQSDNETVRSNHDALQEQLGKLEATLSLDRQQVRTQVASIFNAFAAIYHREQLREWGATIEAGAEELRAPTTSGHHLSPEEWQQWETNERAWRELLTNWCVLASSYYEGIKERVLTLSEEQFLQAGVAKAEQFPHPEAYTAYKAFCGRLKNWHNWQGEAERAVHQTAFNGVAAPQRVSLFTHFPERPDEERN